MSNQSFIEGQRRGINIIFTLCVGLLALRWVATVLDVIFGLGWGWDREALWLGPAMIGFAILARFSAMAILKFVGSNYR